MQLGSLNKLGRQGVNRSTICLRPRTQVLHWRRGQNRAAAIAVATAAAASPVATMRNSDMILKAASAVSATVMQRLQANSVLHMPQLLLMSNISQWVVQSYCHHSSKHICYHASCEWDVGGYVISHTPQCSRGAPTSQGAAAAANSRVARRRPSSSSISGNGCSNGCSQPIMYGPLQAYAYHMTQTQARVTGLMATDLMPDYAPGAYVLVLQEQVAPTEFCLHLQPAQPGVTRLPQRHGQKFSPAGQGTGLQVFPGSTPEVDCEKHIVLTTEGQLVNHMTMPQALILSQLPQTPIPTSLALMLVDLGDQPDKLQAEAMTVFLKKHQNQFRLSIPWKSLPFAPHTVRRVIRMALTPSNQLTMYLAPAAPAQNVTGAPADVATASPQPSVAANISFSASSGSGITRSSGYGPRSSASSKAAAAEVAAAALLLAAGPDTCAAGAGQLSIGEQQQRQRKQQKQQELQTQTQPQQLQQPQQQCIDDFMTHFKVVRLYCTADSGVTQAVSSMSSIALGCMAAIMQQQQHSTRQQLLEQYVDAEAVVMAYCAGNRAALDAFVSMTSIALRALTQAV